jgi:hypothetical protein
MLAFEIVPLTLQIENLFKEGLWVQALQMSLKFINDNAALTILQHRKYILKYCKCSLESLLSPTGKYDEMSTHVFSIHKQFIQSQTQPVMIAEICFEYCIAANIIEVLFSDVFEFFVSYNVGPAFISALESAILTGAIRAAPEKLILALIDFSVSNSKKSVLETCILNLTLDMVDIPDICTVLLASGCYSAYIYTSTFGTAQYIEKSFCLLLEKAIDSESDLKAIIMDKLLLHYIFLIDGKRFPGGEYFELDVIVIINIYNYIVQTESTASSSTTNRSILLNFIEHDLNSVMYCLRKALDCFTSTTTVSEIHSLERLLFFVSKYSNYTEASIDDHSPILVSFFSFFIDILIEPQYCCYGFQMFLEKIFSFLSSFQPKVKAEYFSRRIASNVYLSIPSLATKTFDLCKKHKFWLACNVLVCHDEDRLARIESYFRLALLSYLERTRETTHMMQVFEFIEEVGLLFHDEDSQFLYPAYILDSITHSMNDLVIISKEKSVLLSSFFVKADNDQLLNLLSFSVDEHFKYEFLKTWFLSREDVGLKSFPSDSVFLVYFELLSRYRPSDCIDALSCHCWVPCREKIMEVARTLSLYHVQVYIFVLENDILTALDILFKEFLESIQILASKVDSSTPPVRYNSYCRPSDSVLACICNICVKKSSKLDGELWFITLKRFLQIKDDLRLKSLDIVDIIDKSLRLLISFMLRHLRSSEIARNLTLKSPSSTDSDEVLNVCSLFLSVMGSLRIDHKISVLVSNTYRRDKLEVLSNKFYLTV